ncbi:Type II secretion system (T2SS)-associated protein Gcp16 [Andalucia godoyi]|uniref:Type II secretion system (T2SS)-associated protein Gcp16 n=1 Tax=Andalucia godoyi TaxID=505711 RepID=A0A8K0F1X3_ANDGO|nr:Type II secretion system (T2SS)-associated protein Gcp16 [Andalucia godoyi]|eukprot:ANDGO_01775.mRNA.1 Type II secretion system (T2SS)-associated protein Gcp16
MVDSSDEVRALSRRGIVCGPGETVLAFAARVKHQLGLTADEIRLHPSFSCAFSECAVVHAWALSSYRQALALLNARLDASLDALDWVLVVVSGAGLGTGMMGACHERIDFPGREGVRLVFIQLHPTCFCSPAFECTVIAHEFVHAVRSQLVGDADDDDDEVFAYQLSDSRLERWVGPLHRSWFRHLVVGSFAVALNRNVLRAAFVGSLVVDAAHAYKLRGLLARVASRLEASGMPCSGLLFRMSATELQTFGALLESGVPAGLALSRTVGENNPARLQALVMFLRTPSRL